MVVGRPRLFFCKWTQLLPHYWRERVRFLVYNAVKCDVGCIDREEGPDVFGFRRAFLVITLSLVHAVQDAIRLSNEDEWIHYFMLSMYSMMLSYTHRMSGVVYGNLDFDHKGR